MGGIVGVGIEMEIDSYIVHLALPHNPVTPLAQQGIKLSGFSDLLKIRATEAKAPFPSRHDWDSYFRDAKHMNEMKPGERPDTVHFQVIFGLMFYLLAWFLCGLGLVAGDRLLLCKFRLMLCYNDINV